MLVNGFFIPNIFLFGFRASSLEDKTNPRNLVSKTSIYFIVPFEPP